MAAGSAPGPRSAQGLAAFGARSASAKGKVVVVSELGQEFVNFGKRESINFGKREFINFGKRDCEEEAGEGWQCAFVVFRSTALAQLCPSKPRSPLGAGPCFLS